MSVLLGSALDMVSSVLFMRPQTLVEIAEVNGREAIGRRLTCPLLRVSHQLSTLIQMNNTEETMSRLTTGRTAVHGPGSPTRLRTRFRPRFRPRPRSRSWTRSRMRFAVPVSDAV